MTFAVRHVLIVCARTVLPAFALMTFWIAQAAAQAASPWPNPAPAGPGQFPSAAAPGAGAAPAPWPGQASPGASASHPSWGGSGQQMGRPGMQPAPGKMPCEDEYVPLRTDAQNKGNAIRAVAERKAPREEICAAFKTFVAAEAKMVKFVEQNGQRCGVPADIAKVMKANHGKSVNIRNQVCNAARAAAPPPPSLSDALGTSRVPDTSNIRTGRGGTYDTLTGSPLAR